MKNYLHFQIVCFLRLTTESILLLLYTLQYFVGIGDSAIGACQILSSRFEIKHFLQLTCLPECNVYRIDSVGQSIQHFNLFFLSLFTIIFSLDVNVQIWCGL
jgi:hypothetical protein